MLQHPVTADELTLYAGAMEQIKGRLGAALGWLKAPLSYPNVEAAALQTRLAMEVLMLSSLIPNRGAIEEVATAFARKDHDEARKLVSRVNPSYWPEPIRRTEESPGRYRIEPTTERHLLADDYPATWGKLSALLHARNPFQASPDLVAAAAEVSGVARLLRDLLDPQHLRRLRGGDHLVIAVMNVTGHGRAQAFGFERTRSQSWHGSDR